MKRFLFLILLLGALAGGGYYAYQRLLVQPVVEAIAEDPMAKVDSTAPTPVPIDPLKGPMDRALALVKAGDLPGARDLLAPLVIDPPASALLGDAKKLLGEIHLTLFLSPDPSPEKIAYTVVSGDSVGRIASRNQTTFELLTRLNGLTSTTIRVGQQLLIPQATFSLAIQPGLKRATILRDGSFFTEYPLVEVRLPAAQEVKQTLKITGRLTWKEGKQIPYGDPQYLVAARWIQLEKGGYTLYTVQPPGQRDVEPPASGFGFIASDMREIFLLLTPQSEVHILP